MSKDSLKYGNKDNMPNPATIQHHGKAKCKRSGCDASFSFKIDDQPTELNPNDINCEMKGKVTHKDDGFPYITSSNIHRKSDGRSSFALLCCHRNSGVKYFNPSKKTS